MADNHISKTSGERFERPSVPCELLQFGLGGFAKRLANLQSDAVNSNLALDSPLFTYVVRYARSLHFLKSAIIFWPARSEFSTLL